MPRFVVFIYYHNTVNHINSSDSIFVGELETERKQFQTFIARTHEIGFRQNRCMYISSNDLPNWNCTVTD